MADHTRDSAYDSIHSLVFFIMNLISPDTTICYRHLFESRQRIRRSHPLPLKRVLEKDFVNY